MSPFCLHVDTSGPSFAGGVGSGEGNHELIRCRDRDLLDHAFLRSVSRTSAVNFRVPPTRVLELGCGVCRAFSCRPFFLSGAMSLIGVRLDLSVTMH